MKEVPTFVFILLGLLLKLKIFVYMSAMVILLVLAGLVVVNNYFVDVSGINPAVIGGWPGWENVWDGESRYDYYDENEFYPIWISSEINDTLANRVTRQIAEIEVDTTLSGIRVFINSNGGDPVATFQICDAIKNCSKPVSTITVSRAYSGAAMILSSGDKGRRYAAEHAEIMVHRPWFFLYGAGAVNIEDIESQVERLQMMEENLFDLMSKNTGKTVWELRRELSRDRWFNTERAIDYGLIDKIWHGANN